MVEELYAEEPASLFETIPYAHLSHGQELLGVYGYYVESRLGNRRIG